METKYEVTNERYGQPESPFTWAELVEAVASLDIQIELTDHGTYITDNSGEIVAQEVEE